MTTTRLYGPCWMRRERPTLIGRTDQTVPHSATDTGTVKPEPRESFAACNTESGSRKMKKCSSTPPRTAPRCFAVLSRPSMTLPEVERPPPPPPPPFTSAVGPTFIKDKEGIRARLEEHFDQLLIRSPTADQESLQQIPQKLLLEDPDLV